MYNIYFQSQDYREITRLALPVVVVARAHGPGWIITIGGSPCCLLLQFFSSKQYSVVVSQSEPQTGGPETIPQ